MRRRRLAAATILAAALQGVVVPPVLPARADTAPVAAGATNTTLPGSLVFLKEYDVWVVRPDGSGLRQVTRDGTYESPYYSPSMSDAGIIAAGKGQRIVRMRQDGTVLNSMDPPPITNSVGQPQDGVPVDVAISPDGSRIAWSTTSYTCPIGTECGARTVTGVTSADRLTPPTTTSYFADPTWVSGRRLMVHGGYLSQMMLQDLGGGAKHWFDDKDYAESSTDLGDGWLSRDGRFLVATRGYAEGTHLFTYRVSGDPRTGDPATLPVPTPDCATNDDAALGSPTISPDATAFAFQDGDGLTVMRVAETCEGYAATTIVPGGTRPFWSPAPVQTGPSGPSAFTLLTRPTVSGTPRVGRRLNASGGRWRPAATRTGWQWLRDGQVVRGATSSAYRLRRADRGHRVAVRVTVRRAGLPTRSVVSAARRVRR